MTISTWLNLKDDQKAPMSQRSSWDSRKLSMVLNKIRGYGMMISMPFYSLLGTHSPQPIPTSISTATAFLFFCKSTISPCRSRRLLPKLCSKSKWNTPRNTWSRTSAWHDNYSASRSSAMLLGSVSVRNAKSHQSSDDSPWSILTVSRHPWIPM
jgi:hypothetical protein